MSDGIKALVKKLVEKLRVNMHAYGIAQRAADVLEALLEERDSLKDEVERLRGEQRLKSLIGPSEDAVERIIAERDHLRVALARTAASLAAAISLLETDGKAAKKAKKAAPSDKMFELMLADYNHALDGARKALEAKE